MAHEGDPAHGAIKRIIVMSDGTGNSAARVWRTNVWRVYQALDLSNGRQVGLYDDGVGSSSFAPLAILGGVFGWGLKRNVLDLYRFVCRNWQDGADIYGFGFSRGAFTIRVLMGLIATEGLVPVQSEQQLRRDAAAAYRSYRRRYNTTGGLVGPLRAVRDAIIDGWNRLHGRPVYRKVPRRQVDAIRFMGLWDTVAAYGLPIEEMTRGVSDWLWPLSLPDRRLNAKVRRACHALSLDDERTTFHPVLWTERGEGEKRRVADERISQVWFAGVHSNVGGGYADDALAHVSLRWMMGEAAACGLEFKGDKEALEAARLGSDQDGRLYDSRRGPAAYYRYGPRHVRDLSHDRFSSEPDDEVTVDRPKIHESVFHRINMGARAYAPIGLPARYAIVAADGHILDDVDNPCETPARAALREARQERIWDLVWKRRVVYFATLAASSYLALFPWVHRARAPAHLASPWSFLSPAIETLGRFLPGFAGPWLEAFAANPGWFLIGAVLVGALMWSGGRLAARISNDMRLIWTDPGPGDGAARGFIHALRTHRWYRLFFRAMKRHVLPTAFAAVFVVAGVLGASRLLFAAGSQFGLVCSATAQVTPVTSRIERPGFDTRSLCWASGVSLEADTRYRIAIEPTGDWMDGAHIRVSDLNGFGSERMTPLMYLGLPIRRAAGEPWFRPFVRVGSWGADHHALHLRAEPSGASPTRWVGEVTARTSGELFVYVNDSVVGLPWLADVFYRNNRGTATVIVERL
jgi:uncharacterized protein (DUF2235 family)